MVKSIVVIGAGVNGLSCAVKISEYFQQFKVTLVSEDVSPYTTGDGSAGLWGPYLLGSTPEEKIVKWSSDTHKFFLELWKSGLAAEAGVCLQPMIRISTDPNGYPEPSWKNIVYGLQTLNENQLKEISKEYKKNFTGGHHFVTFTCEPVRLLPYLMKRFIKAGGIFEKKKIENFDQLENFDLIVNCTGLGSKDLVGDENVIPIRGQVIRVQAPWVFHTILDESDDGNYVIANIDTVVLGGTHQENDYSKKVSFKDSGFIMSGCEKLIPSLKFGRLADFWVGLRPGRSSVRLEKDTFETKSGRKVNIVHNYGHGGSGLTLSWGCATDVLNLAKESINYNQSKL